MRIELVDIAGGTTGWRLLRLGVELNLVLVGLCALALMVGSAGSPHGTLTALDPARPDSLIEGWGVLQSGAAALLVLACGRRLPAAFLLPLAGLPLSLAVIELLEPHLMLADWLASALPAFGAWPAGKLVAMGLVGLPVLALAVLPLVDPSARGGWLACRLTAGIFLVGSVAAALDLLAGAVAPSRAAHWATRAEEIAELFLCSWLAALAAGSAVSLAASPQGEQRVKSIYETITAI